MRVCIEVSEEELEGLEKQVQARVMTVYTKLDTSKPLDLLLARLVDAANRQEKSERRD